jgi:hypothetical protein
VAHLIGRLVAWINLAFRFGIHLLRLPGRPLRQRGALERYLALVVPEGYRPLTPAERAALPPRMACVHCGLCALAAAAPAPAGAAGAPAPSGGPHSAWDEAWSFVAGSSRAIDRPAALAASVPASASAAAAAACPQGVPIAAMAAAARGAVA